jgi:hypothetical protein
MINVLVVATPRSGSSALISDLDGQGDAIFGELLLPTSPLDLRSTLLSSLNPFEFLKCCGYIPSKIPGVAVVRVGPGDPVVPHRFSGFKIMAYHAFRNMPFFYRCVKYSDVIVTLKPISIKRQISSLAKISAGNHAHSYVQKSRVFVKQPTFGHVLRSSLVIMVNNTLLYMYFENVL